MNHELNIYRYTVVGVDDGFFLSGAIATDKKQIGKVPSSEDSLALSLPIRGREITERLSDYLFAANWTGQPSTLDVSSQESDMPPLLKAEGIIFPEPAGKVRLIIPPAR